MTREEAALEPGRRRKKTPGSRDTTATVQEGDFLNGRKELVIRDETPKFPGRGQPRHGNQALKRAATLEEGAFREPARSQWRAPEDFHSRQPRRRRRRVMACSRPGGQPPPSPDDRCSHPQSGPFSEQQEEHEVETEKARVARRRTTRNRDRLTEIESPYRSRNPRKQRTRTSGNARTQQRTRPAAQGPEVERRERQPPNKGTDRSQDPRPPPRMRRSSDQRERRTTTRGQDLPGGKTGDG
jgi:hypothetical protein